MPSGAHDDLRLLARATVHLQGLGVGERVFVDPGDAYIAELLEATFLVPVALSDDTAADDGRADA